MLAGVGYLVEVVGLYPFVGAPFAPVADAALIALLWASGGAVSQKGIKTLTQTAVVVQVVLHPKAALHPVAQHQVHILWISPLHVGQQLGVVSQLDHELGLRPVRQLGVGHFVAPAAKVRRRFYAHQKVGIAHESALGQRRLKHDVGPRGHGIACGL